jgi:hypothetical protein
MTPQEVLSAAKQGNPQAIAALMNLAAILQGFFMQKLFLVARKAKVSMLFKLQ